MDKTIEVNGEAQALNVATLGALLAENEIEGRGVAVALNGSVVPRAAWADTALTPGDSVEIVRAKQGG